MQLRIDERGEAAKRFGARTSGLFFVYDADGRLRFRGGLTAARGHEGDNAGLEAAVATVRGETPETSSAGIARSPVFGCALFADPPFAEIPLARGR